MMCHEKLAKIDASNNKTKEEEEKKIVAPIARRKWCMTQNL